MLFGQVAQEAKSRKKHFKGTRLAAVLKVARDGERDLDDLVQKNVSTVNVDGEPMTTIWRPCPKGRIARAQAIYREFFGARKLLSRSLDPLDFAAKSQSSQQVAQRIEIAGKRKRHPRTEACSGRRRESVMATATMAGDQPCFQGVPVPSAQSRKRKREELLAEPPSGKKDRFALVNQLAQAGEAGSTLPGHVLPYHRPAVRINHAETAAKVSAARVTGPVKVYWAVATQPFPPKAQWSLIGALPESNVVIVDSLSAAMHARGRCDGDPDYAYYVLGAAICGLRLADLVWVQDPDSGHSVCFRAAPEMITLAIFISPKVKKKHPKVVTLLQRAVSAGAWTFLDADSFLQARKSWQARRKGVEPIALVSGSSDVHPCDPQKGVHDLRSLRDKVSFTRG